MKNVTLTQIVPHKCEHGEIPDEAREGLLECFGGGNDSYVPWDLMDDPEVNTLGWFSNEDAEKVNEYLRACGVDEKLPILINISW